MTDQRRTFLFARDPSLISYCGPTNSILFNVRANLQFSEVQPDTTDEKQENDTLPIYLRIKNGYDLENLYEISENTITCKIQAGTRNKREGTPISKSYTFSSICSEYSQKEMFHTIVKPKVLNLINGKNCTIFTYGVSGSGKTFTINGTGDDPGLIPRTLEYLFRIMPKLAADPLVKPLHNDEISYLNGLSLNQELLKTKSILSSTESDYSHHLKTYKEMQKRLRSETVGTVEEAEEVAISIYVSFAEIYNERVYDLLKPSPPNGQKRAILSLGCFKSKDYIKNLTSVHVRSDAQAYQVFRHGSDHLVLGATGLNQNSSRSHSIFTIKLLQVSKTNGVCMSKFNFCDLAGCERLKKTHNAGERLKESNNINSSLLVLSRCIHEVRNAQLKGDGNRLIPFRESKLTQLFQRALSGEEYMAMVVTVNPSREYFAETQHVLNFAAIAKEVKHCIEEIAPMRQGRFSQLVEAASRDEGQREDDPDQLYEVINILRAALEEQKLETEERTKMIMSTYADVIAKLQEQHQSEIEELKAQYSQDDDDDSAVIILNSSSEEEDDVKDLLKNLSNENTNLKAQLNVMKSNESVLLKQIDTLKEDLNNGVLEYNILYKVKQEQEINVIMLNDRIAELENHIKAYKVDLYTTRNMESDKDSF